ncbi:phage scaffolding protein (plasmid) [Clostridioides difficile]|uniref:phage scaffolding protein n=1 Tax=Clostridioides difficile TaxID=1496 RepID=UPI0021C878A4|nr:phage scaffolding protein [Clostridioides difficile]UWD43274.1 phage scaffolding protein [Clostridioides difficile]UWD46783.1 phage scaffolding protein [Clostridioides difficile]
MNKEFLSGLGLKDDIITQVLESHSSALIKEKEKYQSLEIKVGGLEQQLKDANKEIKGYKDMNIEDIQKKALEWETKYNDDTKALKEQLEGKEYENSLKELLGKYKFSSELSKTAVLADLKEKKFKNENGTLLGADEYLNQLKEKDPGAFLSDAPGTVISSTKGLQDSSTLNKNANANMALRALIGRE